MITSGRPTWRPPPSSTAPARPSAAVLGARRPIWSTAPSLASQREDPAPLEHSRPADPRNRACCAVGSSQVMRRQRPMTSADAKQLQLYLFAAISSAAVFIPCSAAEAVDVVNILEQVNSGSTAAGAALFVVAYVGATVLLLPASVLTLAAGYLFGPLLGTALVSAGSTLGCSAAFLLSRTWARPAVEARIQDNQKFQAVDKAIASQGPKVVFLLRLSPLFPFSLLNYGLGLSQVDFWPYVGASWLGMLPGTFGYVYLGGLGRATVDAAATGGEGVDTVKLLLYAVGAVATLAVTKVVSSAASKALEDAQKE